MGVDYHTAKWLKSELEHGRRAVENGRLLTLGRQNWWLTKKESEKLGLNYAPEYSRTNYADLFFTELGYTHESLDISLSEGADIKHDMSRPVDVILHGKYDVVLDLGTAEHVADQRQYWENVYNLLAHKGTLIGLSPADGLCGHGLYQISPEFFQNLKGFTSKLWLTTYGPLVKTIPYTGVKGKPYRWRTYCRYILQKTGPFSMPVQKSSMVTTAYSTSITFARFILAIPGIEILRRTFL